MTTARERAIELLYEPGGRALHVREKLVDALIAAAVEEVERKTSGAGPVQASASAIPKKWACACGWYAMQPLSEECPQCGGALEPVLAGTVTQAPQRGPDDCESGAPAKGTRLWRCEHELTKARAELEVNGRTLAEQHAEIARLRACVDTIANGGMAGVSEAGCTWCLAWAYDQIPYLDGHTPDCPILAERARDKER
jgi:hypothetical protein